MTHYWAFPISKNVGFWLVIKIKCILIFSLRPSTKSLTARYQTANRGLVTSGLRSYFCFQNLRTSTKYHHSSLWNDSALWSQNANDKAVIMTVVWLMTYYLIFYKKRCSLGVIRQLSHQYRENLTRESMPKILNWLSNVHSSAVHPYLSHRSVPGSPSQSSRRRSDSSPPCRFHCAGRGWTGTVWVALWSKRASHPLPAAPQPAAGCLCFAHLQTGLWYSPHNHSSTELSIPEEEVKSVEHCFYFYSMTQESIFKITYKIVQTDPPQILWSQQTEQYATLPRLPILTHDIWQERCSGKLTSKRTGLESVLANTVSQHCHIMDQYFHLPKSWFNQRSV